MDLRQGQRSEAGYTEVTFDDTDEVRVFMQAYPQPSQRFSRVIGWLLRREVRKKARGEIDTVSLFVRNDILARAGKELRVIHADNVPAMYGHGNGETAEASSERGAHIAHRLGHMIGDHLREQST